MSAVAVGPCSAVSDRLTEGLGGFGCSGSPFVSFRNPAHLSNWTLPVLELTMVAGAVLAIGYAVRRRRAGDPAPLVLILASLVYLVLVEPAIYFPNKFGISDSYSVFVHNLFTVDFLYDRLPLYIISIYVVLPLLAFEIVRSLGLFERRGALVAAVCVGVVFSSFYEVFDQLGPQLRWWGWNTGAATNHPMFASVPLTSIVLFSAIFPAGLAYAVYRLVGRKVLLGERIGPRGYAWRTVLAGALAVVAMGVVGIPSSLFGGKHPNVTAQAIVLSAELGLMWLVAVPALVRSWRESRSEPVLGAVAGRPALLSGPPGAVGRLWGPVYLLVMAGLWASALPAFTAAVGGVTADRTPIGNLPFAAACFAAAVVWVAAAADIGRRASERMTSVIPAAGSLLAATAGSAPGLRERSEEPA